VHEKSATVRSMNLRMELVGIRSSVGVGIASFNIGWFGSFLFRVQMLFD
jgi:hypothetical protein